eukprot:CAMPEP_0179837698 /NCGR_PEP_ID=MMETSP0982-20121206/192_1 /TAXON_ID=483367 /ORGANISM="non described non described, Strain CCMP 2436" /LENGTH=154 /DNA_ID=CAMNT_0021720841 /DNA_START=11 /DNA_END=476 /DNA_ORIENTATION=+
MADLGSCRSRTTFSKTSRWPRASQAAACDGRHLMPSMAATSPAVRTTSAIHAAATPVSRQEPRRLAARVGGSGPPLLTRYSAWRRQSLAHPLRSSAAAQFCAGWASDRACGHYLPPPNPPAAHTTPARLACCSAAAALGSRRRLAATTASSHDS